MHRPWQGSSSPAWYADSHNSKQIASLNFFLCVLKCKGLLGWERGDSFEASDHCEVVQKGIFDQTWHLISALQNPCSEVFYVLHSFY